MFRFDEDVFPIVPKLVECKRQYNAQLENDRIEYSKWSTIDKIDVAPWRPNRKVIWINGGTMQSFMRKFDGNLARLKKIEWDPAALPFQIARNGSAVIIGSAGGYEVLCALSHGFKRIVAIEMDPVICELLKNEYADYTGNIFHLPQVSLLADEGRSALKRMNRKFDVIQMVNSHNADLLLSGALSISETYIYTVESFKDYWDHLQPDGFVYILHWNGERLFATALKALREMGVERPRGQVLHRPVPERLQPFLPQEGRLHRRRLRDPQGLGRGRRGRSSISPDTEARTTSTIDDDRRPGRDRPRAPRSTSPRSTTTPPTSTSRTASASSASAT